MRAPLILGSLFLVAGCGDTSNLPEGGQSPRDMTVVSPGGSSPGVQGDLPPSDLSLSDLPASDLSNGGMPDGESPIADLALAGDQSAPADGAIPLPADAALPVADLVSVIGADAAPMVNGSFTVLGGGTGFRDVSSDQGGNVWAVTDSKVYFFKKAGGAYSYDQGNGLAHGKYTWTDSYWCIGANPCPAVNPVTFSAVAGGVAGQAFIGNIGYLGDRLNIDPATGAVITVQGLEVGKDQQPDPDERLAQQQREVATWRAALDLNGTFSGTAYFGGWHGTSALHGLTQPRNTGVCNCPDFEEHVHPFSVGGNDVFGGDVHAAFIDAMGDVWLGDRKAIYLLPQRSRGAMTDLFVNFVVLGPNGAQFIDVFPNVDDWNYGVAADQGGGVWVASNTNGLAYLAPNTYMPTYYKQGNGIPSNQLTGVDIDAFGAVWIATQSDGVVRYTPGNQMFTRFTMAQGLPSNNVRQVQVDKHGGPAHAVYFATSNGIGVYSQP